MMKYLAIILALLCSSCALPMGPDSIPDLFSEKYFYKTCTENLTINDLQRNLSSYALRCGYGLDSSWRTLERTSNNEAMLVAQNGQIRMFGAKMKEENMRTQIDLYTWGANEYPEYFLIALENGQCLTGTLRNNPVLIERMKQQ